MKTLTSLRHLLRGARIISIAALSVLALGIVIPATALAASSQLCGANDVKCVIGYGDQFIAQRQASLTKLNNVVISRKNEGHITGDQANTLQTDVSINQNNLAALKTKLDAETNASTARQDVSNIFTVFRIYLVVLPRDTRELYLDIEFNLKNKMKALEPQIQQAISKAPASEQAQLKALFNDYTTQISTTETQFDAVNANLPALTPPNFDANPSGYAASFSVIRTAEQTIHTDLHQAGSDLHQIAQ